MRRTCAVWIVSALFLLGLLALAVVPAGPGVATVMEGLVAGRTCASELHITWPPDLSREPNAFPGDRSGALVPPLRDNMRVGLEVLVDGLPLTTVWHRGRSYLPVPRLGVEYEIRVSNRGPRRIAAIVSVDGLSVVNGRPASVNSPGYLVDPRREVVIRGWRKDLKTVAAFRFEERERSYAGRMGYPENIGVIGLIAVEEQRWRLSPFLDSPDRRSSDGRKSSAVVGGAGTGYGRDIDSAVQYVPFRRSANKQMIVVYYDTAEALRRAGVPVDGRMPDPFPRDTEFAPPPPPLGKSAP